MCCYEAYLRALMISRPPHTVRKEILQGTRALAHSLVNSGLSRGLPRCKKCTGARPMDLSEESEVVQQEK